MDMKDFGIKLNGNNMESKFGNINLNEANQHLREQDPLEIIQWVINMADNPILTTGFMDVTMGIPQIDSDEHQIFTEQVKLEPFKRALNEHNPDVWFTNLRRDQTEFRKNLDILHVNAKGILKVSPFFYYSEFEMDLYLQRFDLPNEKKYFDPTKVLATRECGIHL